MTEPLEALKKAIAEHEEFDFRINKEPKCPHCGFEIDLGAHDLYSICEEGEHQIDCPQCELEFTVSVEVDYSFSTTDQPEPETK